MNTAPLVSCIMPTANRQQFVPRAIQYFLRQTYPNLELVIIDDGEAPVQPMIPADDRIHYEWLGHRNLLTGAKRNLACAAAKGDIIVHWDDDDWYAPEWAAFQAACLLRSQADICGLSSLYFHDPKLRKSWKYVYPSGDRAWVAGATMVYTKQFWQAHRFKEIKVGEDNDFAWFSGGKVAAHDHTRGFVSILHPNNTSPKYTANIRWQPQNFDEVNSILGSDAATY